MFMDFHCDLKARSFSDEVTADKEINDLLIHLLCTEFNLNQIKNSQRQRSRQRTTLGATIMWIMRWGRS